MDPEKVARVNRITKNLSQYINILQRANNAVNKLRTHAKANQLNKRAICATKAQDGLNELIEDLEDGMSMAMEILGAKKVPITNLDKPKLRLVVDNERRKS